MQTGKPCVPSLSIVAVLFALSIALLPAPEDAHAHAVSAEVAPEPTQSFAGLVVEVQIDDRVTQQRYAYRELRLDDGTTLSLDGPAADGLPGGTRARIAARRRGNSLEATNVEVLAASSSTAGTVFLDGTLAIAHADDFANGHSRYNYEVHDDIGGVTTLNVTGLPAELHGGSRVHVSGKRGADGVSLDPETITVESGPAGSGNAQSGMVAKAGTSNSVLVIMANFNNTAAPSYTQAQALQTMVSNSNSVANFYNEVSYGGQLLNVTVTSTWVTMNLAGTCDYTSIATAANAASGYNTSNYNFVVYLFPPQSCGWAGLAYVGFPHQAFINGPSSFSTQVVTHEMGHNFGLLHAGSLSCGGAAIGGSCSVAEYGDPWDTMGNQRAMHFNAAQKSKLGWIASSSVKTHSSGSATYTLSPLESGGGSTYAVKIPTSNTSRTYWLEFRQPIGFDAALSGFPTNGAQVRVANPFEWAAGSDDTEIVDMTPGSAGGFGDSALVVGQSYLDSTYGVNIIVTGATSSALTVTVTKGGGSATTTTLSSSANPSTAGSTVTFTATVTGTNPTGSVNFADGGTSLAGCAAVALSGSGNTRTVACSTAALSAGTHSVTASYGGDASNNASSSSALSQTVNGAGTTTGIATSLTPSTIGSNVTFTATVSGSSPTGTVNFKDGSTSISGCSAATLAGSGNIRTASCATAALAVGSHSVTGAYSGDASNGASASSALTEVVNKSASSTSASSSANPSSTGATVTFTASVTGFSPSGTVNFTDGGTSIGGCNAVALTGSGNTRTAACSTAALTAGTHSIVASYAGDASNSISSSNTLSQAVNGSGSTTGLATSLNPSVVGTSVTFTATVNGTSPTGTVIFKDGSTSIAGCSAVAVSGSGNARTASCPTAGLATGSHGITAAYSGDASNSSSTSTTLTQTVNKATAATSLSSSVNPSAVGAGVTFTATVSGFTPGGAVNFTDGGTSITGCGAVALGGSGNTRSATCATSALGAGTHSINAAYAGDANNNSSSSTTLSQVVNSTAPPPPPSTPANPGFETPALPASGYQYNPSGSGIGWTFSANSGIQANGSPWTAASAPQGVQTALIQGTGTISQALTLTAGTYTLSFKAAQRPCCVSPYVQPIKVTVDGIQIGSLVSPSSSSFTLFNVSFTVGSSGTHTIGFAGTDSSDKTTFLDDVTLVSGTVVSTSTALASSANPGRMKTSVTFTATVNGSNPTGQVAFTSGGTTIAGCGAVALSGSGNAKKALCTTSFGVVGTYNIVATYGGDASNGKTPSAPLAQVIKTARARR